MLKKISGIYCIECLVNGKRYIGCAVDIHIRVLKHWNALKHGTHHSNYFQRAYNKYGRDAFISYTLQELPNDHDLLEDMEVYWIAYYDSFIDDGKGYNMTRGGDGCLGGEPWNKGIKLPESMRENVVRELAKHTCDKTGMKHPEGWGERQSIKEQGRKKKRLSSSIYVGVGWDKDRKLWTARLNYMMKHINIGRFKTEKEAAEAYNKKAIELYGDNARLNIIKEE